MEVVMQKLTNEEVKSIAFNILKHIKQVCEANNIKYTLMAGTLLGAVRHQGFIPWDDDIDIGLPLPDYKKLVEILKYDKTYRLYYDLEDSDYYYKFAKLVDTTTVVFEPNRPKDNLLGVWVDIFPLLPIPNHMPRTEYIRKLDKANEAVFASMKWNYYYAPSLLKRIAKAVVFFPRMLYYKAKGTAYWKAQRALLFDLIPYDEAKEVGNIPSPYGEREIWPKEIFESYTTATFEGEEFSVVEQWDACLRITYGDYMQLPPVEKRVGGHFDAYYR